MNTIIILIIIFLGDILCAFDPKDHKNWKLLKHDICGKVQSDRIIGGKEAPMNAYPWLARVGYANKLKGEIAFRCSGAIISDKIIITAGHCVADLPKNVKVRMIRLGEHDIDTNPDCRDNFCADPVIDIEPSEIIVPQDYNNPIFNSDIGLIRLAFSINFTTFVKPICLPHGNLLHKDFTGSKAEVAGWGIFNVETRKVSHKLLVVKVPIMDNKACQTRVPSFLKLSDYKICAGGEIGKDSCGGDSGGPLMKVDDENGEPKYYVLGVVSFGSKRCGKTFMPGVYTRMTSYTKWVLDNLDFTKKNSKKLTFY